MVDSSVSGDHSGSLRRSQSDRTEYNQKLQGKLKRKQLPQVASPSSSGFGWLPFAEIFEAEEKNQTQPSLLRKQEKDVERDSRDTKIFI